jgi:DnaJ-class molecular chaperone
MTKPYDPVCAVCHGRPKMDRSDCCEECWYSGRYVRESELLQDVKRAAYDAKVREMRRRPA